MKQIMYCEEKMKGLIPDGQISIVRGKVNWWGREEIGRDAPEFASMFDVECIEDRLDEMKETLKKKLLAKNYVFFDTVYYHYILNKGKIKEFGISFRHIQ